MDDDDLADRAVEKQVALLHEKLVRRTKKTAGVVKGRAAAAGRDPEDAVNRFYKDMLSQMQQCVAAGNDGETGEEMPSQAGAEDDDGDPHEAM